jgi:hypothetical protein
MKIGLMITGRASPWVVEYLPIAILFLFSVPPSVRLLRRVGLHAALAAFNIVPFFGAAILLWIVAYSKWPKADPQAPV